MTKIVQVTATTTVVGSSITLEGTFNQDFLEIYLLGFSTIATGALDVEVKLGGSWISSGYTYTKVDSYLGGGNGTSTKAFAGINNAPGGTGRRASLRMVVPSPSNTSLGFNSTAQVSVYANSGLATVFAYQNRHPNTGAFGGIRLNNVSQGKVMIAGPAATGTSIWTRVGRSSTVTANSLVVLGPFSGYTWTRTWVCNAVPTVASAATRGLIQLRRNGTWRTSGTFVTEAGQNTAGVTINTTRSDAQAIVQNNVATTGSTLLEGLSGQTINACSISDVGTATFPETGISQGGFWGKGEVLNSISSELKDFLGNQCDGIRFIHNGGLTSGVIVVEGIS